MLAVTIIHPSAIVIACLRLSVLHLRYFPASKRKYRVADVDSASSGESDDSRARDVWILRALLLNTLFILTHLSYRIAELSTGFGGKIMTTEVYFNVLNGTMVLLTMATLNILFSQSFTDLPGTKRRLRNEKAVMITP